MTPPVNGNSALFLDIDGTLLDMARTPDAVTVPDELKKALANLSVRLEGALAFVSGRSLAAIDALFAPFHSAAIGCHGAEVRSKQGNVRALAPPLPDNVRQLFVDLAHRHPGVLLEDKIYALSLHYRLAPEARPALSEALSENAALFAAEKISIVEGKAVFDARRQGVDKGVGVRALAGEMPFKGRALLFGGDDTTDMDVFAILPDLGGRGFSVGRAFAGVDYVFESPLAVRQWLTGLAESGLAQ